jgi:hypothetical protein
MKIPTSFLSPWFNTLAGIVILFVGLGVPNARAGSGYKDIAKFEEGTVATLSIVVEYKPDGSRSINVRFNRPPYGGSMFFHGEEWKVFSDNLDRVKSGPDGVEQKFADLDTPGGSLLRMSSVRQRSEISLTLIRQSAKGDSYPSVPFHLAPADFENLLKAVVEAAKADIIVSAASASEFAQFRKDLGTRFTPEQLQDLDTAVLELQLDAMHRNIATSAGREADMLAVANRKTVPAVVLLGWRARKARLLREIPEARQLLDHDAEEAAKTAATGTPESVTRRLNSEKEVLAKLKRDFADTNRHLTELAEVITSPH